MAQSEHSDKDPTVEELLELAKSTPTTYETERPNSVDEFILHFKIRPIIGQAAWAEQVYWVYRKWCIANDIEQLTRYHFAVQMGKRFATYSKGGRRAFRIEKKNFEISQEEYFEMRKFLRDAKAKKAKKRRKVSGSKPKL